MKLALALALIMVVIAGCGSDSDADERSFDDLFDEAVALYCHDVPISDCRDGARLSLTFLASGSDYSREEVLAYMVDELDPDQFTAFEDAVAEAVYQLILR